MSSNREALREGPVRLLGYANELGESFRPLVSRSLVNASYGVAGAYVVADAAWRCSIPTAGSSPAMEAGDTLLWQGLASVAVPGFVINRIVWAIGHAGPASARTWLPTAVGLACIPLIVHPIDEGVTRIMDATVRTAMRKDDKVS